MILQFLNALLTVAYLVGCMYLVARLLGYLGGLFYNPNRKIQEEIHERHPLRPANDETQDQTSSSWGRSKNLKATGI